MHALSTSALLLLLAVSSASCGDNTPTAAPSDTPASTTEIYAGTLAPGGSGFYSFRVVNAGSVAVTLASLTTGAAGTPVSSPLRLELGVPDGEGCTVTTTIIVTPGLRAQLTLPLAANIYCVQLSDTGALTGPVSFGVRIVHS